MTSVFMSAPTAQEPQTNLEVALLLAELGVRVFPCQSHGARAKTPCEGMKWQNAPIGDNRWLNEAWQRFPDAIPGMELAAQNILVIDTDGEEGQRQWAQIIAKHGGDAGWPRTITPNGVHHFFLVPEGKKFGNGLGSLTPKKQGGKIDVRGPGAGYVIAPGAEMYEGDTYFANDGYIPAFLDAPEMPGWLIQILEAKATQPTRPTPVASPRPNSATTSDTRTTAWAEAAFEQEISNVANCMEGGRNDTLNVAAFSLFQIVAGGHLAADRVLAALRDACEANGLMAEDCKAVEDTIRSGKSTGMRKPRAAPEGGDDANMEAIGRAAIIGFTRAKDGTAFDNQTGEVIEDPWLNPDLSLVNSRRRAPPALLPVLQKCFRPEWVDWIIQAAESAAAPPDYVFGPLLAFASVLIGNARWADAGVGWTEPPHLWFCVVGDSGSSKSPGSDCVLGQVLPKLEARMMGNYPELQREWAVTNEMDKAKHDAWLNEVRTAQKLEIPPPLPPVAVSCAEPQAPRLRQNDVTIEKLAAILANGSPKGVLVVRDELAGFFAGMNNYNDGGRAFFLEAHGGRTYRVERQKSPNPIIIPRLAIGLFGGTQPEKLAEMFRDADDGLLARVIFIWPDAVPFKLGRRAPGIEWAVHCLDRLRRLELTPAAETEEERPARVPLVPEALDMIEAFAQKMQQQQTLAGGLMRSAFGKTRGFALRLSLSIEMLNWAAQAEAEHEETPSSISANSLGAACTLIEDYFMPMAERVYGDAGTTTAERNVVTMARWVARTQATEVHVRDVQRVSRLPGMKKAEDIKAAADVLVEAGWLRPPLKGGRSQPARQAYAVNPAIALHFKQTRI